VCGATRYVHRGSGVRVVTALDVTDRHIERLARNVTEPFQARTAVTSEGNLRA